MNVSAWNLAFPIAVLAACGPETAAEEPTATSDPTDTDPTDGPQCEAPEDCDYGSDCINGFCEYQCYCGCGVAPPAPADRFRCGYLPYYECYSDVDCATDQICENNECVPEPSCIPVMPQAFEVEIVFGNGEAAISKIAFVAGPLGGTRLIGARGPAIVQGDPTVANTLIDTGAPLADFAVGDLDSDAIPDLVTVSAETPQIRGFRGLVDGSFDPTAIFVVDAAADQLVVGDLDGDGRQDVIVRDAAGISLLAGDGAGGLASAVQIHAGAVATMAAIDADGNGNVDVAYTVSGSFAVVLGGGGALQEQPLQIAVDDHMPVALHVANLDNGPSDDLIAIDPQNVGQFWMGEILTATPSLFDPLGVAVATAAGDTNADGWDDLISADGQGRVWLRMGGPSPDSPTPLACSSSVPISFTPIAIEVGDHDGDGDANIIATDGARVVALTLEWI